MRIIIDAMGGDHAPTEIIKGVCDAKDTQNADFTLVGDSNVIREIAENNKFDITGIDIVHTSVVIKMDDPPIDILKEKNNSSMAIGLKLLSKDNEYGTKGDAFVSAGNTGALHAGSTMIVRKIPGIKRSGIATILPFKRPLLLMDAGANPKITEDYLVQWALIGSVYMQKIFGIERPEVGLLNNGTEEGKGTDMLVNAYNLLSSSRLNFAGNVESKEIPFGPCDVVVCDGFTGNVVLKMIEGMGKYIFEELKCLYSKNTSSRLSFLMIRSQMTSLKKVFDASERGGAPLLGLASPVIKAHGSSNAKAIYNAIRQAISYADSDIITSISERMDSLPQAAAKNF